jgi:hypothetical protein
MFNFLQKTSRETAYKHKYPDKSVMLIAEKEHKVIHQECQENNGTSMDR